MNPVLSSRLIQSEHELKFPLPAARVPLVSQWLRTVCRPHADFFDTHVFSLYYDTPTWDYLNEKINSDYLKVKVRLRWYKGGPVFIETKQKEGSQRIKVRRTVDLTPEELDHLPLDSPRLLEPLALLREEGVPGLAGLIPMMLITYRRARYTHSFSPSVYCLDHDIRIPRVNHSRFRSARPFPYPYAVLEQKGPMEELDPLLHLQLNGAFRLQRGAFSKYMNAYFWLTDQLN